MIVSMLFAGAVGAAVSYVIGFAVASFGQRRGASVNIRIDRAYRSHRARPDGRRAILSAVWEAVKAVATMRFEITVRW